MKKYFRILFAIIFIFSFVGCSWQVPEKISVKTRAEYNFCIGNIEKDFSEFFAADKILDNSFSSQDSMMFDYYPGKTEEKKQQYLMKMPIQDIPVNFSQYFDDTKLASSIRDLSFEKTIKVPKLDSAIDEIIPTTTFSNAINTLVTATGKGSQNLTFAGNFTSITYGNGSVMKVEASPSNSAAYVVLKYNGNQVASGTLFNGKCDLKMDNVTVYKTGMSIDFSPNVTNFSVRMDSSSKISSVKEVTIGSPITIPVNASLKKAGTDNSFSECVVEAGNIDVEIAVPSNWQNVEVSYDIAMSGAINTNLPASTGTKKQVPLNGLSIQSGDTNVISNVSFTLNKANIDFTKDLKLKATPNVSKYSSIGIKLDGVKTSMDETQAITTVMKSIIVKLNLAKSGLKGSFINTLPEGNDITLVANSDFIGLKNKSQKLTANTSKETDITELISDSESRDVYFSDTQDVASNKFKEMDFKIDITLPGSDAANPNKVVIKSVEPETEYSIKIKLEPDVNWNEVTLKSDGTEIPGTISTGLNLNSVFATFSSVLGGDFEKYTSIKSLPIYLYAVKPDMKTFENANFTGSLNMYFSKDGGITDAYPAQNINFMKDGKLPFKDMPVLKFDEDEENSKTIVTKLEDYAPSAQADLKGLLDASKNDTNGSICASFKLKFSNGTSGTFTVTKEDFDKSKSNASSIAIFAFVQIPLEFETLQDVKIDFLNIAAQTGGTDLLGRTEPPTQQENLDFLEAIQTFSLYYKSTVLPFYATPAKGSQYSGVSLCLDWDGSANDGFIPKILDLEEDIYEIENYNEIINLYPLCPEIYVVVPKGSFSVPRKAGVNMNLNLKIQMDPRYELVLKGGN